MARQIDWNAIRAEYIGGTISTRKLAEKYGIKYTAVRDKSISEGWVKMRERAESKARALAEQKTAAAAADNAVLAAEIRARMLGKLRDILDRYPADATEIRTRDDDGTVIVFRLRDLTGALKDLTDGMTTGDNDKNNPVLELIRRLDSECI